MCIVYLEHPSSGVIFLAICTTKSYFIYLGSVWIELIVAETENWKYCSKIIFKCMNSAVGPILNFLNAWTVQLQCVNSDFCLLHSKFMWFYCSCAGKKRKTKTENVRQKHKRQIQCNPNGYFTYSFCKTSNNSGSILAFNTIK